MKVRAPLLLVLAATMGLSGCVAGLITAPLSLVGREWAHEQTYPGGAPTPATASSQDPLRICMDNVMKQTKGESGAQYTEKEARDICKDALSQTQQ